MMTVLRGKFRWLAFFGLALAFLEGGCNYTMRDQPRYEPLSESRFFPDGSSARPAIPGVVPREYNAEAPWFYDGRAVDGGLVDGYPFPVTMEVLARGRERYDIYCSPCHGYDGAGQGMIVQRGFTAPPSFHQDYLRSAPVGHFVDVIANGFGQMYAYAYRVEPADRWAIAAYIRALQLSQNAGLDDVPPAERQQLEADR